MTFGEIVFNSDKDEWNIGTSVFNERINNRSKLLFVIENEDREMYGYYLDTKIDVNGEYQRWIPTNEETFLFSMRSNGRNEGMKKFIMKDKTSGYWLQKNENECLISLGATPAIVLSKKDSKSGILIKNKSYCNQYGERYVDYEGIPNALCGRDGIFDQFELIRILVIQMI